MQQNSNCWGQPSSWASQPPLSKGILEWWGLLPTTAGGLLPPCPSHLQSPPPRLLPMVQFSLLPLHHSLGHPSPTQTLWQSVSRLSNFWFILGSLLVAHFQTLCSLSRLCVAIALQGTRSNKTSLLSNVTQEDSVSHQTPLLDLTVLRAMAYPVTDFYSLFIRAFVCFVDDIFLHSWGAAGCIFPFPVELVALHFLAATASLLRCLMGCLSVEQPILCDSTSLLCYLVPNLPSHPGGPLRMIEIITPYGESLPLLLGFISPRKRK